MNWASKGPQSSWPCLFARPQFCVTQKLCYSAFLQQLSHICSTANSLSHRHVPGIKGAVVSSFFLPLDSSPLLFQFWLTTTITDDSLALLKCSLFLRCYFAQTQTKHIHPSSLHPSEARTAQLPQLCFLAQPSQLSRAELTSWKGPLCLIYGVPGTCPNTEAWLLERIHVIWSIWHSCQLLVENSMPMLVVTISR